MLKILGILGLFQNSFAGTCPRESAAEIFTHFNGDFVKENSGLEWTPNIPTSLFHINDSGGGPYFYISNFTDLNIKKIKLDISRVKDIEALSIAKCPRMPSIECLYISDTGNNRLNRQNLDLFIVPMNTINHEKNTAHVIHTKKFFYPEARFNVEGMAIHPISGDMFVATKEQEHTKIYRLPYSEIINNNLSPAELVGIIHFAEVVNSPGTGIITGMDISHDGKSFTLLSYDNAYEVSFDLSELKTSKNSSPKNLSSHSKTIKIPVLEQQESIAYHSNNSLLYTTEQSETEVPVYIKRCE